jgi:virginiamycin A acetyltransferase
MDPDLVASPAAPLLKRAYRVEALRKLVVRTTIRLEGGRFRTRTLRELLATYHGVEVGAYSYGPCLVPGAFPPDVAIGRYVSIADGVRVFRRDHPLKHLSLHPFFYNRHLGVVDEDTIRSTPLSIEHDAWIGERAIIVSGCSRIGLGAAVAAGAVVTKDVPDFAIVAGVPARVIGFRFEPEVIETVRRSRWWESPIDDLRARRDAFIRPFDSSTQFE